MFSNIVILTGGTALAQIFGILASPILSRIFSTYEFGIFGSIMATVSIASTVSILKYDMAIVVEDDDKSAFALVSLCFTILFAMSLLLGLGIYLANEFFDIATLKDLESSYLIWIIPIVFTTGVGNILNSLLNRDEQYKDLAKVQIIRRVGIVSIQIILGLIGIKVLGLILGNFIGVLITLCYIFYLYRSKFNSINRSKNDLISIAKKYKNFPIYVTPQTLINAAILHVPVLVLGAYYGLVTVGAYFFTLKIVQMPMGFLGQAVRRVFYREASVLYNGAKKVDKLFFKTTLSLVLVIFIPVLILIFFGPQLFVFFFGEEWKLAGEFVKWMILWYGAIFIMSPSRALFLVFNKQRLILILDSLIGVIRLSLLIFLCANYDAITAIAGFSIVSLIFYVLIVLGWGIYLKGGKYANAV